MHTSTTESLTRGAGDQEAINDPGASTGRQPYEGKIPIIEVTNLSKMFGSVKAVDSINFEVLEGEIFGLIGLNGAGKTTTILMLSSLLNPDTGSATVRGYDIVKEKDSVRRSIGLVFEEEAVDVYLTGKQNLDFAARMYNLPKEVREKRIAEVLKNVGLKEHADTKVNDYSGGMLRRLEIARGMLTYPEILLLDEPTIGLDAQTRRYLWDYIRRVNKEMGITVLLSTSYLDEADYLCNRLAIMDKGRIIVSSTPEELKKSVGENLIMLKLSNGSEKEFIARLQKIDWVKGVEKSGDSLVLSMKDRSIGIMEIVKFARGYGFGISSIESSETSLNDVLLHYTGKRVDERN
jgi:ABC-2 type transport system ATP-binding protein